jgi:hypothetical protein
VRRRILTAIADEDPGRKPAFPWQPQESGFA